MTVTYVILLQIASIEHEGQTNKKYVPGNPLKTIREVWMGSRCTFSCFFFNEVFKRLEIEI